MNVRLDQFDPAEGYQRGAGLPAFALWQLIKLAFFTTGFPWPSPLKAALLRAFGARIGRGLIIKPRVNIHLPWKLTVGDHCWIGEEVFLLNFEPITLGSHVCISQRAFLCTGNHDFRKPSMPYRNAPIRVHDGAWIGAASFVAPGIEIGEEALAQAGSVVLRPIPPGEIHGGNPASKISQRNLSGS